MASTKPAGLDRRKVVAALLAERGDALVVTLGPGGHAVVVFGPPEVAGAVPSAVPGAVHVLC